MIFKNILVTGGAGFIGSNFIPYFIDVHEEYNVINLDKLTYVADLNNLKEVENNERHKFVKSDICDKDLIEKLFKEKGKRRIDKTNYIYI
jgi:dTDP-glucose 4,6-dehydratase